MGSFDFVEMKFPAKADYVGVSRLSISGIASRMGFDYEAIEDLKIAVSEAITNVVSHAYEDDEQGCGEVTIGCGIYRDRLEVMVADHGGSFDLEDIKDKIGPYNEVEPIENLREGGFGLFLIDALMDKLEINNEYGVIIVMTKYLEENGVDLDDEVSGIQARER